jgi:GAF domain-containing protein
MFTTIKEFFTAPIYESNPEKSQDARTTHRVAVALLGLAIISIPLTFLLGSPEREFALYSTAFGIVLWLIAIILVKRQNIVFAKIIILGVNTLNLMAVTFMTGGLSRPTIVTTLFLLALSTLLFPRRGAITYGGIILILSTVLFIAGKVGLVPEPTIPNNEQSTYLIFIFTLISVALILSIASANTQLNLERILDNENELRDRNIELNEFAEQLETRVAERTAELEESSIQVQKRASQLETIADVASSVATLQDVNELLPYITKTISERFDFYHAGIFLISEDREYAVLRAANSEGGQKMLARKHKLRVGKEGIVGFAVEQKRARIALDVGDDAVYFDNPDLPATRSEMALPLMIGKNVIGVLDVQSEQSNAFSNEDIKVLSTLANQVAVAIENARLFQQSQEALKELDMTFQRYISSEWQQFMQQTTVIGYRANESGLEPITDVKGLTNSNGSNGNLQKIPIKLRGASLGTLSVDMGDRVREYTQEEESLILTVADRLAMALESARLLEDSQRVAAKEQIIGQITGKIGSSINLRNVLQTAVEELGHAIPGSEIVIKLESDKK